MPTLQTPFSYERLNPVPLDVSAVFDNLAAFTAYLAGPVAYVGQIVAVRNATNAPDIYRINEDKTYSAIGGGGPGTVTLAGDVTGASGTTTVERIRGRTVATTVPANGQAYTWNSTTTQWTPTNITSTGATLAGDVTGATSSTVVERLRGRIVSTAAPATNQYLGWTGTQWQAMTIPANTGPVTLAGDVVGASGATTVVALRGRAVSLGTPLVGQALIWSGSNWNPTTRSLVGDVIGFSNANTVTRIRNRTVSHIAPVDAEALRWNAEASDWRPWPVGEPTAMLDGPPTPGELKFGQLGCEYKATPIRLWIGVPVSVNNMEARLLIGTAPPPTVFDGGATIWDGGATTWDNYS